MQDHRPQLQVEAGEEVGEEVEAEEYHEDDDGNMYEEASEEDQVEQPFQVEAPPDIAEEPAA
eukprot:735700-Amphidinium_carterae.1